MYRCNLKPSIESGFTTIEILNDQDLRLTLRFRPDPRYPNHLQVYFNSINHPITNRRDNNEMPTIWKEVFINKDKAPFFKRIYSDFNHASFHLDNKGKTTNRLVNFHFSNPEITIKTNFKNMDAKFSPIMSVIRKYNSNWEMISLIQKYDIDDRRQHTEKLISETVKSSISNESGIDQIVQENMLEFLISNPQYKYTREEILEKIIIIFKNHSLKIDLIDAQALYSAYENENVGQLVTFDINPNYCISIGNNVGDNIDQWKNTYGFVDGAIIFGNYSFSRFATMPDEKTIMIGYY